MFIWIPIWHRISIWLVWWIVFIFGITFFAGFFCEFFFCLFQFDKATKPNIIQSCVLCVIERKIMFNFTKLHIFTICQLYNLLPCLYKTKWQHYQKNKPNYFSFFFVETKITLCRLEWHMVKSFVMPCTLFRMVFVFNRFIM